MASDLLVQLIVDELKTTPLGQNIDVSASKAQLSVITSKLDKQTIDKINTILGGSKFLQTCVLNIQEVLKDGKVNLQDVPYFLNILKALHEEATQFTVQKSSSVSIDSSTMFTMCEVLIDIILVLTVSDPIQLDGALKLVDSALSLAQFSVPSTVSWTCCC